ncbi:hypothetical protein VTI74DRAFT_1337 [Chaetomium olivicolor]
MRLWITPVEEDHTAKDPGLGPVTQAVSGTFRVRRLFFLLRPPRPRFVPAYVLLIELDWSLVDGSGNKRNKSRIEDPRPRSGSYIVVEELL